MPALLALPPEQAWRQCGQVWDGEAETSWAPGLFMQLTSPWREVGRKRG